MIIGRYEIEGAVIFQEDIEQITKLLNFYDWHTGYIENSGQRNDAERQNKKYQEQLLELGVVNFTWLDNK
jgi:hypothetical protein